MNGDMNGQEERQGKEGIHPEGMVGPINPNEPPQTYKFYGTLETYRVAGEVKLYDQKGNVVFVVKLDLVTMGEKRTLTPLTTLESGSAEEAIKYWLTSGERIDVLNALDRLVESTIRTVHNASQLQSKL